MSVSISASEVARGLAGIVPELVRELLPGGKKQGNEWVCGSLAGEPGRSLSVRLTGGKTGVWSDFSSNESGDALDLVAGCLFAGDRKQAYRWGLHRLGYGGSTPEAVQRREVDRRRAEERVAAERRERDIRVRRCRALFGSASRLRAGDPVISYLAGRGISMPESQYPRAVRYHSSAWCQERQAHVPAMVSGILGLAGQLQGLHVTYLEKRGGRWQKASVSHPKKIFGGYSGQFIPLANGDSGRRLADIERSEEIAIGEGIETCLSVAVSCPEYRVLCACSLYNMGRLRLPETVGRVLLLADNDDGNSEAQKALQSAVDAWRRRGVRVRTARAPVGNDFNDTLVQLGAS